MKYLTLLFILCITQVNSQNSFKYSYEGLSPKDTVIQIDSLSAIQLYKRTVNWVKETFVSPDDVILSEIENDYIRFRGVSKGFASVSAFGITHRLDARYSISIYVKDGRYKFEPESFEVYFSNTGWMNFLVPGQFTHQYFKKKNQQPRKSYKSMIEGIGNELNLLVKSHLDYLINQNKSKRDDW